MLVDACMYVCFVVSFVCWTQGVLTLWDSYVYQIEGAFLVPLSRFTSPNIVHSMSHVQFNIHGVLPPAPHVFH